MENKPASITRVAIMAHPKIDGALAEAEKMAVCLKEHGVESRIGILNDEELCRKIKLGEFDLLIALGGDGTMLRAGRLVSSCGMPILGINLGHFGFLMELREGQWIELIPRLLAGDYWLEKRMMLRVEQWRSGEKLGTWDVLNEVVVGRGQIVRPMKITAYIEGSFLATYVADALIAATPTGSTAYALAAGGPILQPEVRNILLVPVAPHLSLDRAIVLAEGSSLSITVQVEQAVFSVDGQAPVGMTEDDRIDVRASEHTALFIRFQDPGYFYRNLTRHMNQNPTTTNQR